MSASSRRGFVFGQYLQLVPSRAAGKGSGAAAAAAAPHRTSDRDGDPEAAATPDTAGPSLPAASGKGCSCCAAARGPPDSNTGAATPAPAQWDHRLAFAATTYRLMPYNIMTNNCHCFVAHFLNQIKYRGGGWDMVHLAALMFLRGRHVSVGGLLYTWLPWMALVTLGGYFGRLVFLYAYAGVCAPLLAWFLLYTWCIWRDISP